MLFAFERDGRWLSKPDSAVACLLVAVIALPWLAAITWKSHGAFLQQAVGKDMLGKVASGEESHGLPPGFYMLTYSLFMWPFGLIAVGAGLQALNRLRDDPRLRFCLAWYIPFWLVFELIPTKLPLRPASLSRHGAADRLAADIAAGDANAPLKRWRNGCGGRRPSAWPVSLGWRRSASAPIYLTTLLLVEHSAPRRRSARVIAFRGSCRCRCPAPSPPVPASPMPCVRRHRPARSRSG